MVHLCEVSRRSWCKRHGEYQKAGDDLRASSRDCRNLGPEWAIRLSCYHFGAVRCMFRPPLQIERNIAARQECAGCTNVLTDEYDLVA